MVSAVLVKVLGPNMTQIIKSWIPAASRWGGAAGVTVVYMTDWRLVLDYVPYINGKFADND